MDSSVYAQVDASSIFIAPTRALNYFFSALPKVDKYKSTRLEKSEVHIQKFKENIFVYTIDKCHTTLWLTSPLHTVWSSCCDLQSTTWNGHLYACCIDTRDCLGSKFLSDLLLVLIRLISRKGLPWSPDSLKCIWSLDWSQKSPLTSWLNCSAWRWLPSFYSICRWTG